ncbi:leucyl aminopeptidase [Rhodobacter veldkampii DSM 11550]|uniref:Leucyl aminopeptidase n=1 Tax=Phaeovulum veldkampii DSM 11550 TaxID=1185920 RepID=A0A2T4JIA5_9RHOB|nr:leucyl aminopeptidase family protein [Phaeovulum veldkampii]MBK5947174.1 leucyl aminopeptidase [Phaeovulum veldkampii DSM 11550]PTE17634.1 leucyl aminopeptidase [Phaeovulum veldkampii DSM 11550]TDQ57543.1 leucyl aminopeptidase [Phaeovulum veldkampii DSM 11550]
MPLCFAPDDTLSKPLFLVPEGSLPPSLRPEAQAFAAAQGFTGALGQVCVLPDAAGGIGAALFGWGTPAARARGRFHLARAAEALPEDDWHLEGDLTAPEAEEAALAWLLAGYRFARYKAAAAPKARLKCPAGVDARRMETIAAAEALTRDLINTPASDMGPEELETAFFALAARHGAQAQAICGDDLLTEGLPMIHAVGRASPRAPRLLDLHWGDAGPRLTLVGKGVCFDTGGLDLKPSSSMGLMKKDMGGAATVMGLAQMIMALGLPLRLRVLVPAVENAVSGNAFRPQDILTSRKGLTVEVNNTDAEGRLVLADALALADEEAPDLLICMATLTGAARVALGPDLPPFYTNDNSLAAALSEAAAAVADPLWRMPFWQPYEPMIEPGIADLDNAPSGGMAGSVTAALFLRRFVTQTPRFAHFDIYGWQPSPAPARPKGAVGQGARAILAALPKVLAL